MNLKNNTCQGDPAHFQWGPAHAKGFKICQGGPAHVKRVQHTPRGSSICQEGPAQTKGVQHKPRGSSTNQGDSAQYCNCIERRQMDTLRWQSLDVTRWSQWMKMDDCRDADTDGRKVGWDPAPKQTATRNRNNGESRSHRGVSRQDEDGWKNKIKKNPLKVYLKNC